MSQTTAISKITATQAAITNLSDQLRHGVNLVVSASIALGIFLRREQAERKQTIGKQGLHNATLVPWKKHVVELTGFSYDQCNRFCKVSEVVEDDLRKSRKKIAATAKKLLDKSPVDWTADDHHEFALYIGERFQANTFRRLMEETGLLGSAHSDLGDGTCDDDSDEPDEKEMTEEQLDFFHLLAAHDCVATPILGLSQTMAAPDEFIRHCHLLPEHDLEPDEEAGRPRIYGRRTLRHILSQALEQLDRAAKNQSN